MTMAESKKRKKKRKQRRILSVFPILYPSRIGTPYTFRPGSGNDSGGSPNPPPPPPPPGPGPGPGMGERTAIRPSRARVLHEMRRALGLTFGDDKANEGGDAFPASPLVEYFNDAPNVAMGGFSLPSFSAVPMRMGGPTIGGPGFQHDGNGEGGRYDFKKSPGLGFRTEMAWKVWEKAMLVMQKEKGLPRHSILLRALTKAGVHRGQLDPAEYRLLEMGIEWYLSDQGSLGINKGVYY